MSSVWTCPLLDTISVSLVAYKVNSLFRFISIIGARVWGPPVRQRARVRTPTSDRAHQKGGSPEGPPLSWLPAIGLDRLINICLGVASQDFRAVGG